jgi:uncharacterized LabA/DUF88 family protein
VSFPLRYAALLDGAFVIRKLEAQLGRFPTAEDIQALAAAIHAHECVSEFSRLRIYFYHAHPAVGTLVNPVSKRRVSLESTPIHDNNKRLLEALETVPDFALRLGETATTGWKVGPSAFRNLMRNPRLIEAEDLVPAIEQKGVDLRIGLDIARLALTSSVQAIVAVTGDSDLIPAFKFARREGLRVFLCHMGHGIKRELLVHADREILLRAPKGIRTASMCRPRISAEASRCP